MSRFAFASIVGSFLSLSLALGGCAAPTAQGEERATLESDITDSESETEAPATTTTTKRPTEDANAVHRYLSGGPLLDGDLTALQKALCVPDAELGKLGPRTPVAIRIFKETIGRRATNDSRVNVPEEYSVAITWDDCDRSKFANFFEARHINRPSDVEIVASAIQEDVYGIKPSDSLPIKLSAIRRDIAAANKFFNIDLKGAREDEVTAELFVKLRLSIRSL